MALLSAVHGAGTMPTATTRGGAAGRTMMVLAPPPHMTLLPPPAAAPRVATAAALLAEGATGSTTSASWAASRRCRNIARSALMDAPAASFISMMDDDEDDEQEVVEVDATVQDESLKVENLGLCSQTVAALQARGISSLFPIQKSVFQPINEGRDLIGRAKTGSGKTLAFALPVVEACLKEDQESGVKPKRGRAPRCIVLAPTRELANQVAREFETVCPSLTVVSVYGGVAIGGNIKDLERGCDVVVGTPGRVIDLIERDCLKLDKVRYAILDEADQMLDMGFEEDMEKILSYVPEKRQTLLFSATLPKWVNKVARRFQTNPLLVDLVGEENTGRLADTIRLLVTQVDWSLKNNALLDSMATHATGGKTIVFVNTKARADEVCDAVSASHATGVLHGDISQAMRDRALQQFRDGKVTVLVATDVAARGLDIPAVDLVVHYDVPLDNESFLHRSGRTGRAGKTGTAVVLFTEKEVRSLALILRQCKVDNAELVGPPEPKEALGRAARGVLGQLDKVDQGVIDFFIPAAEKLLASEQPSRVLAAALAALGGFRQAPQPRSLLTYEEGMVTLRLMGPSGAGGIDGFRSLLMTLQAITAKATKNKKHLEYSLGKVKVLSDRPSRQSGAAFDLPSEEANALLGNEAIVTTALKMGYTLDKPKALPLDLADMLATGERGGRFGRGGDDSRGGRFSRGGGGGGGGFRDRERGSSSSYGSGRDRGGSRGGSDRGGDRGFSRGGGREGSWGGSSSSPRRGGASSGGASSSMSRDDFFDPMVDDAGYFGGNGGSSSGGGRSTSRSGGGGSRGGRGGSFSNPKDGQWAQW